MLRNGSPELVSAALVDPRRGGQTTSRWIQAAQNRGIPYKRPMSSSGRLSVDLMMMMNAGFRSEAWLPVKLLAHEA
ncbi:jg5891 [Pararge aegeria aegeria]|uniref:Jg5891 protein n=1 Tax=Pararge aegeria aegeria TaxID=348720 RepID=A0A8S4RDD1_9NEOP|nr:jg5891 [Pararge aegeria aegeria]